jgi:hypothetical protein
MHQQRKTWVSVLKSVGVDITDLGAPAVSNQWILNKVITKLLLDDSFDYIILQLTSLGKLDVEVDSERHRHLVVSDPVRNFTLGTIWPSSHSMHSLAKQLFQKWLVSPGLEIEDIYCKVKLLEHWCSAKNKNLLVYQAYPIPWNQEQRINRANDRILYNEYRTSEFYQLHDHTNDNEVPCIQYQIDLAKNIALSLQLPVDKIEKIQKHYTKETK